MSTETQTVKTEEVKEAVQDQKTSGETSTQTTQEVNYEAELAKVNAELKQTQEERENYRKGMLKAKGKLPEDVDTSLNGDEDLDAKIDRKVAEKLLETKEAQAQAKKDELIKEQARKLNELTLALKNRNQIGAGSGQGSNQDKSQVTTDKVLSSEQIAHLKAQGRSDAWIEQFKKNLSNPTGAK